MTSEYQVTFIPGFDRDNPDLFLMSRRVCEIDGDYFLGKLIEKHQPETVVDMIARDVLTVWPPLSKSTLDAVRLFCENRRVGNCSDGIEFRDLHNEGED